MAYPLWLRQVCNEGGARRGHWQRLGIHVAAAPCLPRTAVGGLVRAGPGAICPLPHGYLILFSTFTTASIPTILLLHSTALEAHVPVLVLAASIIAVVSNSSFCINLRRSPNLNSLEATLPCCQSYSDSFVVLEQVSNPDERLVTVNTIKVVIKFSRDSPDAHCDAEMS